MTILFETLPGIEIKLRAGQLCDKVSSSGHAGKSPVYSKPNKQNFEQLHKIIHKGENLCPSQ